MQPEAQARGSLYSGLRERHGDVGLQLCYSRHFKRSGVICFNLYDTCHVIRRVKPTILITAYNLNNYSNDGAQRYILYRS